MNNSPNLIDFGSPDVEKDIERVAVPRTEEALPVSDETLVEGNEWLATEDDTQNSQGVADAEELDIGYDLAMDHELLMLGKISTEDREGLFSTDAEVFVNARAQSTEGIFRELGLPAFMANFVDIEKQADIREYCRDKLKDGLDHDTQDLPSRIGRYKEMRAKIERKLEKTDEVKLAQFRKARIMWAEEMGEFATVEEDANAAPTEEDFRPGYRRDQRLGKVAASSDR